MAEVISLRAYLDELDDMLERESPTEVVSHCRYILQHHPQNVAAHRLLAQALLLKGQREGLKEHFDAAAEEFQRVLSAVPNDHVSHLGLSEIRQAEGSLDAAIWHMERAYEQLPGNRMLHEAFRKLLAEREGEENVPHKIQLTRTALARQYANGQLYDQALVEVRRAQEQAPGRTDLQVLLAEILWDSGRQVEAGEAAIQVLKKLPDSLAANRIMARLWLDYERPTDARPFVERLEALDPYAAAEIIGAQESAEPVTLPRLDYHASAQAEMAAGAPEWVHDLDDLRGADMQDLFAPKDAEPPSKATAPPASMPAWEEPAALADAPLPDWFSADGLEAPWELAGQEAPVPQPTWLDEPPAADPEPTVPDWFADLGMPGEQRAPAAEPFAPGPDVSAPAANAIDAAWLLDEEGEPPALPADTPEFDWWTESPPQAVAEPSEPAAPPPAHEAPHGLTALLADLAEDYGEAAALEEAEAEPESAAGLPASAEPALPDSFAALGEPPTAESAALPEAFVAPEVDEPPLDLFELMSEIPAAEEAALPDLFGAAEEASEVDTPDASDFWSAFERAAAEPSEATPEEDTLETWEQGAPQHAALPPVEPAPGRGVPDWLGEVTEWEESGIAVGTDGEAPSPAAEDRSHADVPDASAADVAAAPEPHLPEWLSAADLLAEPAVDDWLSEFEVPAPSDEADADALPEVEGPPAGFDEAISTPVEEESTLPDWLQLPVEGATAPIEVEAEQVAEPVDAAPEPVAEEEDLDDWLRSFTPTVPAVDAVVEAQGEAIPVVPPLDEDVFTEEPSDEFFRPVLPELPSYLMEPAPEPPMPDASLEEVAAAQSLPEDEAEPDWLAGLEPMPSRDEEPPETTPLEPLEVAEQPVGPVDEAYDPFEGGSPDQVPQYASAKTTGILQPDEQPDWMGAFTAELRSLDALPVDSVEDVDEQSMSAASPGAEPEPEPTGERAPEPPQAEVEVPSQELPAVPEPGAEFFATPDDGPMPGWLEAITSAEDAEIDAALFGDLPGAQPEPELFAAWDVLEEGPAEPEPAVTGEPFDLLMEVAAEIGAAEDAEEMPPQPDPDQSTVETRETDALSQLETELAVLEEAPSESEVAETEALAQVEAELDAYEAAPERAQSELDALAQLEAELAGLEAPGEPEAESEVGEEEALAHLEAELAAPETIREADALAQLEAELAALQSAGAPAEEPSSPDALAQLEADLAAWAPTADGVPAAAGERGLAEAADDDRDALARLEAELAATSWSEGDRAGAGVADAALLADTRTSAPDAPVPADFSFGDLMPLWLRRPLEADPAALEHARSADASERPEWLRDVSEDGERE